METSALWTALTALVLILPALAWAGPAETPEHAAFELDELREALAASDRPWLPFFESRDIRLGLYALPAGASDPQPVHDDDEVYHVIRGRAVLRAGDDAIPVEPGSTVFVRAGVEHRFVEIEEDLEVLVFFATGPGSLAGSSPQ